MESNREMESFEVDVEQILYGKSPKLKKLVPGFVIRYLKRIVHQDEINTTLRAKGHLKDNEFNKAILKMLGITYNVYGADSLPSGGRYIFVSNHPLGGLDGIVFINELSDHYPSVKFPVNDILLNLKNYSGIFVPINKHGSQGREAAVLMEEAYASDSQILYFPAGLCSRRKGGVIKDLIWQKSFVQKAIQYKRDIIPCYFSGRNSSFFYNLASIRAKLGIKANIEMLYLADEMFSQKEKDLDLVFGEPVSWETFDKSKSLTEWAGWIKNKTYDLSKRLGHGVL
jgi:1-acyl-sn-glycerol-3-phosphate acyltransferase